MQKKTLSLVVVAAATFVAFPSSAAVIAAWTMATAIPAATVGISYTYGAADSGDMAAGTVLSSSHTSALTTYSTPAGNGSTYSFSSNNWTTGDYYQVSVSTIGYDTVSITWDQTRSGTGPSIFDAVMSIDGGASWTTILAGYTVIQAGFAGTGTTTWNTTVNQAVFFTQTASSASAANQSNVLFRLRSTVTTAAAGTNRIDNVIVQGSVIPAPGAIALLGLAGLVGRRRR